LTFFNIARAVGETPGIKGQMALDARAALRQELNPPAAAAHIHATAEKET
jgi:hypothetical protein